MKKHNFYAGPSILPQQTIEATSKAVSDYDGLGLSLMELSHRSKECIAIMDEALALIKELLNVPEGYKVILIGGGASTQFAMVPFNLMRKKAMYVNTGSWSGKAMKEAKLFGDVIEVKGEDFFSIPKGWDVPDDVDYVHITSNNTIFGTQYKEDLDLNVPLVADMSSDIFSRPIDISKYAIIYGGAQKNLAPAGIAFAIVREDVLGKVDHKIPSMLDYSVHIKNGSMFNTPPMLPIYAALQTLRWLKDQGGVEGIQKVNEEKAALLYNEIDRNELFRPTVAVEDRSLMNICFVMTEKHKDLEKAFNDFAATKGLIGLKGHRSVGGFRASTYNALPRESVEALIAAMQEFEKANV